MGEIVRERTCLVNSNVDDFSLLKRLLCDTTVSLPSTVALCALAILCAIIAQTPCSRKECPRQEYRGKMNVAVLLACPRRWLQTDSAIQPILLHPPCQTFLFWPSAAGMGYLRHAHSRNDATCRLDNAFTEANSREQPCKAKQRLVSRGLSLDVYTAECRAPEKPVVFYNVTSRTIVEPIGAMTVAPLLSLLTSTRYICRRSRLACKSGASVVRLCSS